MIQANTPARYWSITEIARALISSNALSSITTQDAILLAQRMRLCQVASGTVVFTAGNTNTDFMALILEGEAVIESIGTAAGEPVVFSVVTARQMIGEMGVVANTPRSANVIAASDMVLAILDQSAFALLIKQVPQIACGFLSSLLQGATDRLRESNRKLQTLAMINNSLLEELHSSRQNESNLAELYASTSVFGALT